MLELALWLKANNIRVDQVQTFLPSPMTLSTAMYYTGINPIHSGHETLFVPRGAGIRRVQKAFIRYHDAGNWPLLRKELERMGRRDLIGDHSAALVPARQPKATEKNLRTKKDVRRRAEDHPL